MKVFNYSNGHKGELIGEIRVPSFTTGYPVHDGHYVKCAYQDRGTSRWTIQQAVGYTSKLNKTVYITPEMFGVSAICFCTGCWNNVWEWQIVGTTQWLEEAIQSNSGVVVLERIKSFAEKKRWMAAVITATNDRITFIVNAEDEDAAFIAAEIAAAEMDETDLRDIEIYECEDDREDLDDYVEVAV